MLIQQSLEELEDDGVELLTASDGEEALSTIAAELPRLVFLDVMMPKKNGFDVCNTVKNVLGMKRSTSSPNSEGPGVRPPARPGGGRGYVYDQALRSGRPR